MIENTPITNSTNNTFNGQLVPVEAGAVNLMGLLHIPTQAHGIVILAHGIDAVETMTHQHALTIAQAFFQRGLATLVVDLFTTEEHQLDAVSNFFRTNTDIMQQRILGLAQWLSENEPTHTFSIGYLAMGTTAAAAMIAAAERPDLVAAVVAIDSQLSVVQDHLQRILAPTLLIATSGDQGTSTAHQNALAQIAAEKRFEQVTEHPINLTRIATLAGPWFSQHLTLIGE